MIKITTQFTDTYPMNEQNKDTIIADLRAEIDTLKTIIHNMPGNMFWRNMNGVYMGCNKNNADLIGLASPDQIVGKRLQELMDPASAEVVHQTDLQVIHTGKEIQAEEFVYDKNGNSFCYLSQKSPIYNKEGKLIGLLGVALNITEQKRVQELLKLAKKKAEAASRAKSQFLSMISHELRTPLTSILGFIRFLEQDNLSAQERKECLSHIRHSGSYLLSLVNNILDYNKLEAGKLTLTNHPINLKEIAEEVIQMLSGLTKVKSIPILLEYDEHTPRFFIGDANVIKQLLINLISNAVKFTEKGHVKLKIKNISNTNQTATLEIAVEDTGIGIPKDQIHQIFKRFHQIEDTYTRMNSISGTGLGLTIVKKLAALMGGKIEVKSTVGKGSIFYFTLTLKKDPSHETFHLSEHLTTTQKSLPKVLIVEDDQMIQIIHRRMLEGLGCEIHIAENSAKALEKLSQSFDLLFVDIGLPDINGFDLIQTIRKKGFKMPIVALTGFAEEVEQKRCLRAGANNVAIKPVSQAYFHELLKQYVI